MTSVKMGRVGRWAVTFTALSVLAVVTAAPSSAVTAVSVTRVSLDAGSVRVDGLRAVASAPISVSSSESTASGRADGSGRLKMSASGYRSSTCKVTVTDGATAVVATRSGCTPPPPPAGAPALSTVALSHTSLSAVGTLVAGAVLLTSVSAAPLTVGLTSSRPGNAPVSQAFVQVMVGSNQAVFTVNQITAVTAPTAATIAASAGGVTKTALLTINPTPAFGSATPATELGPAFVGTNLVDSSTTGRTLSGTGRVGVVSFDFIGGQLPAGMSSEASRT